jgi:WD40 repeat protein
MLVVTEQGGSIFVSDVKNNKPEKLTGTKGTAYQVTFSGDGEFIAAASDDGVIQTWKTQELTNEPIILVGHRGPVYWVAYSPDGTSLASACPADKTIRVWNQVHWSTGRRWFCGMGHAKRRETARSRGCKSLAMKE